MERISGPLSPRERVRVRGLSCYDGTRCRTFETASRMRPYRDLGDLRGD